MNKSAINRKRVKSLQKQSIKISTALGESLAKLTTG